ncbi:phytochelatin synthase [Azospirillum brasilense]|uniref:glutathione gamma-glutamylcysteinyltransferase n=1 Tax=Azospirillum brasilense TaxID=192 RepID=A0A560BY39_AZOBR|nr:phytochelatin synthase family protein [Azospirillum brasilense]TWA77528.1 phytochelatin synthase [Azospirillum brasilense]
MKAPFRSALLALLAVVCLAGSPVAAQDAQSETKPKFGPDAVPMTDDRAYLRRAGAPDFWAMMPYYTAQQTGSACSVASVAMMINALRGLPPLSSNRLVTQARVLNEVDDDGWKAATAENGDGVSFADFAGLVQKSVDAFGLDATVEVFRPKDASPETLGELRRILDENERDDSDIILLAYDQGTLTGDATVGHIAPLGAYDAETHRVLVMDVDRLWYVPYWSSDEKLLEAMVKPDRSDPTGSGLIHVRLKDARLKGRTAG